MFIRIITPLAFLMCATNASATDLTFTFQNPNFGGDPFNGAYLLSLAEAQRTRTISDSASSDTPTGGIGGATGAVTGPTIVIPINPATPSAPDVGDAVSSEAAVDQIN